MKKKSIGFCLNQLTFLFLLSIIPAISNSQTIVPTKVCELPSEISESSGLIKIAPNKFVTHTDSGNEPILYVFDSSGTIQRRIRVSNAVNTDWEEITMDSKGSLYIGDFGNNSNDRKNLKIYLVASPNTFTKDSITAGVISFTYPDQKAFPPAAPLQNFDMEAFFWFNDSLYLFSKDRSNPYSGYSKCYQLPAKAGTFTARLIDSFYTGNGGYLNYSITGAAVYPNGNRMFLLGYDKCWLFQNFNSNKFFSGISKTYAFNSLTQKEGICFENADKVWYTQENSVLGTCGLYRFTIPSSSTGMDKQRQKKLYKIYPNPADDFLKIELSEDIIESEMILEIISLDGKLVQKFELQPYGVNDVSVKTLKSGKYFIRVNGLNAGEFIKL